MADVPDDLGFRKDMKELVAVALAGAGIGAAIGLFSNGSLIVHEQVLIWAGLGALYKIVANGSGAQRRR
jgi:hypothetical protein